MGITGPSSAEGGPEVVMASHVNSAHFGSAVAAVVGTAVIHAGYLAFTEWSNRKKCPGKRSANWPWRVTLLLFFLAALGLIVYCSVHRSAAGIMILDAVSVAHVMVVEHYIVSVLTDAPSASGPKRCYYVGTALRLLYAALSLWQLPRGLQLFYDAPLISRAMFAGIAAYLAAQMTTQLHVYLMAGWAAYASLSTLASLGILVANDVAWGKGGGGHLEGHALAQCVLDWADSGVMIVAPWVFRKIMRAREGIWGEGDSFARNTMGGSSVGVPSSGGRVETDKSSDETTVDLETGCRVVSDVDLTVPEPTFGPKGQTDMTDDPGQS